MNKAKRIIFLVCRILVGLLFIFSGAVKAIDPLGTVYKITDYLGAMHLDALAAMPAVTMVAAFVLFTAELLAGACLLVNSNFKLGLWLTTAFMAVMTPLTVWIAIANPVSDCGCFGDAIVLSNTATLVKNIVIDLFIVALWVLYRSYDRPLRITGQTWAVTVVVSLVVVLFAVWTLFHLPLIDFRPYHVGADIREQMLQPEGTHPDIYDVKFIYSRNGVEKEFALQDVPAGDSSWVFVDQKTELVEAGVLPPIHDFIIENEDGDDLTDEILDDPGRTYMVVMWNLGRTDTSRRILRNIARLYKHARAEGARFVVLTAADDIQLNRFRELHKLDYDFCFVDPIQLKTMVRANPGVVVLRAGKVEAKCNARQISKLLKQ